MKVGIIGYGRQGKRRADWLAKAEGVEIAGVYDSSNQSLVGCPYPIMGNSSAMGLYYNAICVCTPPASHYEIAMNALEAGKHVLIEKPMTLDYEQAVKLCDYAESRKLGLHVGLNMRYRAPIIQAREILNGCGKILLIEIEMGHARFCDREQVISMGGALLDLGSHAVDLGLHLSGYGCDHASDTRGSDIVNQPITHCVTGRCEVYSPKFAIRTRVSYRSDDIRVSTRIKIYCEKGNGQIVMGPERDYSYWEGIGLTEFPYPDDCWKLDCEAFIRACNGGESNARQAAECIKYLTGAK